ncbi:MULTISPECIES: hypothetical protein [Protofrankia]|nr:MULTISPECIES: hypothetical protein [Protofrankia]
MTAIEACVDVAQHICATQGWGPPADNGDAIIVSSTTMERWPQRSR